jgi:hypothetical protein
VLARQLAAGHHPALGWLWVGQETLVDEQILVRERGQRPAGLDERPQQQAFGLSATVRQRVGAVGAARKPGEQGLAVGVGADLAVARRAVAAHAPGQFFGDHQALNRLGAD